MVESNRLRPAFAGADADAVFERQDENFAIADAPFRSGPSRFHDRVHGRFDKILVHRHLQLYLVQEIHSQLMTAINFGMPFLPAETATIDHRQTEYLDLVESLLDGFDFRGLNDGDD